MGHGYERIENKILFDVEAIAVVASDVVLSCS